MTDEELLALLGDDGLLLTKEGRERVLKAMRRAYDAGRLAEAQCSEF